MTTLLATCRVSGNSACADLASVDGISFKLISGIGWHPFLQPQGAYREYTGRDETNWLGLLLRRRLGGIRPIPASQLIPGCPRHSRQSAERARDSLRIRAQLFQA